MLNKKIIIGIVLVLTLGVIVMSSLGNTVEAETLEINAEAFVDTIIEDGNVLPLEDYKIYAEVSGIVEEVLRSEGDWVEEGDVIAILDSKTMMLRLEGLQGQLMSLEGSKQMTKEVVKSSDVQAQESIVNASKVAYELKLKEEGRSKELYEAGALSQSEYERIQVAMIASKNTYQANLSKLTSLKGSNVPQTGEKNFHQGQIIQVESEIEILEDQIDKMLLKANKSGVLSNFTLKTGDYVEAMQMIARLISVNQVEVEVMVLAEEAYALKKNQSLMITRDRNGQEESITGHIKSIAPSAIASISTLGINEKRVKVIVESDEVMTPALMPGSEVDVEFTVHEVEAAIIVPKTAIFFTDEGNAVWVVKENRVSAQRIEKGYESTRTVEVLEGLSSGDQIIKYYDAEGISDNVRIK